MRLLSLSFSLFALASSAPVKTPSFSLISDRSANGTPIIAVTFPNGHSDTLVLTQFVDGDGSQKPDTSGGIFFPTEDPEIPDSRDGGIFFPTEDPEIPESRDGGIFFPTEDPEIPESRDGGIFFPTEDPEIPESRDCRYIGHLRSEPEACLAMTGCVGSEDVEFTILSEHAPESGMFKWNIDGQVENLENPFEVLQFKSYFLIYLHK